MIAILLSSYNGANYIEEQINSLISQTYQDIVVYIRVDGSPDSTAEIVDKYALHYPDKINHVDVNGRNLGCGQSFMWLLRNVSSDYYMFCDQDDVWLPTKVEETLIKMKEIDDTGHKDLPCLVFTDAMVVDSKLNVLYESLWKSNHRNPEDIKDVYRYAIYRQAALGCTMMFNNMARKIALSIPDFPNTDGQHDRLIAYLCGTLGRVAYIEKPLIMYRQHANNVTSYMNNLQTKKSIFMSLIRSPQRQYNYFKFKYARLKQLPFPVSYTKLFLTMCNKWIFSRKWNREE